MEEKKKENPKLTYEQLETAAKQLSAQFDAVISENKQLRIVLQQANMANMYKELEFRFKVLEFADVFDTNFVLMCRESIQEIMTPKTEEEEKEEEEEEK